MSSKQLSTLCKDENGQWQLVATAGRPGGQLISEIARGAILGAVGAAAVDALGDLDVGTTIDLSVGN